MAQSDPLVIDNRIEASNSSEDVQPSSEPHPDTPASNDDPTIIIPDEDSSEMSLMSPPAADGRRAMDSSDEDAEVEYGLEYTDDQKQAMMELGSMKLDLGYTEEDPPEYDVSERVRQLNQELANDPLPENDDRERSIKFKEKLVDLVAPPYDYSDDDGDNVTVKERTDQAENHDMNQQVVQSEQTGNHKSDNATNHKQERTNEGGHAGERVLVERNGHFELLYIEDLSADERRMYGIQSNDSPSNDVITSPRVSNIDKSAPSNNSNTTNKPDDSSHRPVPVEQNIRRPQSAGCLSQFTYVSPYALSKGDKKRLARQCATEKSIRKQTEQEAAEKEQEKREESSRAFQAWLRQKHTTMAEEYRQNATNKKKDQQQEEQNKAERNGGQFKEWLNEKNRQHRQQASMQQKERQEYNEGWYIRPRSQCDTAFKDWLKKKNEESSKTKHEEKPVHRKGRLLMRRSAKTQALLRAAREIQAFRYVDYYGYRY